MRLIPEIIRTFPLKCYLALGYTKDAVLSINQKIANIWKSSLAYCTESAFWKNSCRPFFKRNIKPLNKTDALLIGGALLIAVVINVVAVKRFGSGAFALALGVGVAIFLCACCISHYRVRKFHDAKAWKHVNDIRKEANESTGAKQNFAEIEKIRSKLKKPRYSHLEEDMKGLDENLRKFKKVVVSPSLTDKKNVVKVQLSQTYALAEAADHEEDKKVLKKLEGAINKVGTVAQDITELETQKEAVQTVKTQTVKDRIPKLVDQIDELKALANTASLDDARATFLEQLKSLQSKLDSSQHVDALSPPKLPPAAANLPNDLAPAAPPPDPAAGAAPAVPAGNPAAPAAP